MAASGGPANVDASGWTMLAAPRGLPPALLDRIKRDLDAARAELEVRARQQVFGWEAMEMSRAQLPAFVAAASAKYGEVIRRGRITID